ncbi:MAG: hypothetical protein AAF928_14675 [Myxococcota bacterium]
MAPPRSPAAGVLGALGLGLLGGCGGAAPLLHTAHPLPEGQYTVGAGTAASFNVGTPTVSAGGVSPEDAVVEAASVAPGFAPWVGARVGLDGAFDAGLLYTARTVRADARRAFVFGEDDSFAASIGLGASGLLPNRQDDFGVRVGGFGGDLPILVGYRSTADIYAVYVGARFGAEFLNGQRELPPVDGTDEIPPNEPIRGWHVYTGGLAGFRVGFRYLYAAFELGGDMHWAEASIAERDGVFSVFALRPGGALVARF